MSSRFSNPRFPKKLTWYFPSETEPNAFYFWQVVEEMVEFVLLCGVMMDHICQKLLLVLTQICHQAFTSSTLTILLFSISVSLTTGLHLKQIVQFWVFHKKISTSEVESWQARNGKKISTDISQFLTRPSGELQLWIPVSGSELTASYYYRTLTLKINWFFYICLSSSIKVSIDNFLASQRSNCFLNDL